MWSLFGIRNLTKTKTICLVTIIYSWLLFTERSRSVTESALDSHEVILVVVQREGVYVAGGVHPDITVGEMDDKSCPNTPSTADIIHTGINVWETPERLVGGNRHTCITAGRLLSDWEQGQLTSLKISLVSKSAKHTIILNIYILYIYYNILLWNILYFNK